MMMHVLRSRAVVFHKIYNTARVSEYVHEHCPEEAEEVIRQADLLLHSTFVFTDRWDMEPCSEPYTVSLEDWVTSPNGDPEWVFMLNRHDFLHKLWQAYLLTGKGDYVDRILYFLLDWIQKNPITQQGTDATRTIDTGIRCMNWTILLMHLLGADLISDADARAVLDSIAAQCRNMQSRYIGKYALSNWGVLQTTAICAAHLWFPHHIPENVAAWAWEELRLQLSLQILSDGSHWEQSPMYHVEVLNTSAKLLAQLQLAERIGVCVEGKAYEAFHSDKNWSASMEAEAGPGEGYDPDASGWLSGAVRVLSRHVLYTCDPSFRQLPLGDSDVTDVRDVLARGAVLLSGGSIYRWAAGQWLDLDSVFLLGASGIDGFHRVVPAIPVRRVWECSDSGNIYFRSDWTRDASFTALKCGTLGSSHGHADQTHMSLQYKGKPFLIDSGRYTYLEEDPLRVLLKKPCAHNVCVIDGASGGDPNGSWSYHSYDETCKNYACHKDEAHYAEMGFHGKLRDGTPYLIKRKLIALDCGIWLSAQDVICQGKHQVKEYFHLHGDTAVYCHHDHVTVCHDEAALNIWDSGSMEFRFGVVSEKYNEKRYAPILVRVDQMCDRMTTFTVITDGEYSVNAVPVYQLRRTDPVPRERAAAWDVVKPDGKKYTLILWNRETCKGDKLYACHGVSVYGKAAVLVWEDGKCRTIRLRV
jgi:hypothetical protein